ncbi:hypothetical protein GF377_09680 [candidate division GN15 bacterium]|nr:hypothetical protein [candidate division GN15 bacterium]
MVLGVFPCPVSAQFGDGERYVEEIVVNFRVPKLINQDIFVLYDGETIFVPVADLFELLGIHSVTDLKNRRVHGDFMSTDNPYVLDAQRGRAMCFNVEHDLPASQYFVTETDFYLRVDRFPEIFQLPLTFTFSSLSIYLRPNKDFPAYQKLQRRLSQRQLREQQAETLNEQRLPRSKDYIKGAVIDWQLSSSASKARRIHNLGLNTGGMLFGGDLTLSGYGNSETGTTGENLSYRWHYHIADQAEISQIDLGRFYTTGPYSRSLTGAMVTNKPVVQRKYYQTVQLRDYVGSGWEVELYVNGQLTDFMFTDADGEYNFLVDINYGSSQIELKMYGPNGEIRTEEDFIQVPFNLVPKDVFEYTVAAGRGRGAFGDQWYVQGGGYYGIINNVTAGLSGEYLLGAETDDEALSVTAEATYQPIGNLTVNASYAPNYAMTGSANFRQLGWINANGSVTKYFENEIRNPGLRNLSARFSASVPLRFKGRYLSLRLHTLMTSFDDRTQWSVNYGFSTTLQRVHLNYLGRWDHQRYTNRHDNSIASRVFATVHAWRWAMPQVQFEYDHSLKRFKRYGLSLTKRVFRTGRLAVSFERDPISGSNQVMATFNLYNSFATFTSRVTRTDRDVTLNQSQRGSIQYDQDAGNVLFDRRNAVGTAMAVIRPFLDDNYNGRYDRGEEYLAGLRANIRGAGRRTHGEEKLYYYDRLRAYNEYLVEIDEVSLDNPLLKPTNEYYSVTVNPNVVTSVEVPLVMGGEVSGFVRRVRPNDSVGVSGVRISLLNLTTESQTDITTFAGGEFYHLGVIPGRYRAYIDPKQLERFDYRVEPEYIEFDVNPSIGQDIVDGIDFLLIPTDNETDDSQ